MKIGVLLSMVVAVLLVLGCASGAPPVAAPPAEQAVLAQQAAALSETNVTIAALPTTIVDWQGRMARAPAVPEWVQDVALENWDGAARRLGYEAGGVGAPIYRGLIISGPDLRGAQMRAGTAFAREIARELQQNIFAHLVSDANAMSGPTREAFGEQVRVLSEVTISGARVLREFWQVVEVTEHNRTRRETVLYRLYRFEASDWADITAGYLATVLNQLPVHQRPEQAQVMDMLQHTLNQSRAHEALSLQELQNQLEAQQRMIDAQIAQAQTPEQQRLAAQIELARIQSETEITTVQARTAAETERAAFASHNPAVRAAANTTVIDAPVVLARRLAHGIIF